MGSISLPLSPGPGSSARSQHATPTIQAQQPKQPQGTFWSMRPGSGLGTVASMGSSQSTSAGGTLGSQMQRPQQQQQPTTASTNTQGKDPFADLAGLF